MTPGWIARRFGRRAAEPPLRPERTIWAVGDVHGRLDLLRPLVERVLDTAGSAEDPVLVLLGDYVDRGPDSAGVLRFLHALQSSTTGPEVVVLAGNHEAMMADAIGQPVAKGRTWLRHGGMDTLRSFGIEPVTPDASPADLKAMAAELRAAMPEDLLSWFGGLPLGWGSGNVACVHAGLDPALPTDAQPDDVLLWGHRDFPGTPRVDGVRVVHGHTIVPEPVVADGRIAVDTGAYRTGRLTAARIDPDGALSFLEERE